MEITDHVKGILGTLSDKPGCYIMKDEDGKIIYVGKAISLKNRVRQYFHLSAEQPYRTRQLVAKIRDIETIIVGSELEALILEMNLIKQHKPFFNVRLKDDKRYPYIKISWQEDFPRLIITRTMVNDGGRYFGPYTSVWAVHQTLDVLRHIFPYLTCARDITGKDERACLYYDIKLCSAPCIGAISKAEYRQMIDDLCKFLEGRTDPILKRLQVEMAKASTQMQYERAGALRDQINAIQRVLEHQKIISSDTKDQDVIAMARTDKDACVQIFFIRSGKMIGREYFVLDGTEDKPNQEILEEFIKQFYSQAAYVPNKVLLPEQIEEARIIKEWLNTKRGGLKVDIIVPQRGEGRALVKMAAENAMETLRALENRWKADKTKQLQALTDLQQALNLAEPPNRIECYDISNTQGVNSVGSMVVFEQGISKKNLYRKFNIKTVEGPNDFASMEEVLNRRFSRYWAIKEAEAEPGSKPDLSFGLLPNLIIMDGGKGQLSRAVKVLQEQKLNDMFSVVGLAKQDEELFLPGKMESIRLDDHSQGFYLIQRIRDEAHRFAITAHRNARGKTGLASRLDQIEGIGPVRRKALLKEFGSIEGILSAKPEDLTRIKGITITKAEFIQSQLE